MGEKHRAGRGWWHASRKLPLALVFLGSLATPGLRVFPEEKKELHYMAGMVFLKGHGHHREPLSFWDSLSGNPGPDLQAKALREGIDAVAEGNVVEAEAGLEFSIH